MPKRNTKKQKKKSSNVKRNNSVRVVVQQTKSKQKAPVVQVIESAKSKNHSLVGGKFPAAIQRSLIHDGGIWNEETRNVSKMILSGEDKFHAGLLGSLIDPSRPFPLPSPGSSPFSSVIQNQGMTTDAYGTSAPTSSSNPFVSSEARGTTIPQYTSAGTMLGRYSRYSGRVVATLETVTDSAGQLEVWFFHDPTSLQFPVSAIIPSTSGNYTGMTRLINLPWTSNPYPFNKTYVPELGSNPGTDLEQKNMYYEGGALMHVHTINQNAYLSVSYQTRTGDNTYDRFVDTLPTLWTTADPGNALYLSDTPEMATGAISMYTGTTWHMGTNLHSAIPDEDTAKFATSEIFRRCWASGGPFIRALVRTTNGTGGASGPVQFSISLLTWNATAPNAPEVASSMPFETVPVETPCWARALRTRGTVYKGPVNNMADKLWTRQLEKIPASIIPSTPLTRAILSNPRKVIPAVVNQPIQEIRSKSNWMDAVKSAAVSAAPSVGQWLFSQAKNILPEVLEALPFGLSLL